MDGTTTTTFDPDLLEEAKRQVIAERGKAIQGNGSAPAVIRLKPSEDRLNFHVKVGDWRKAQTGNVDAIVKVLAAFMVDNHDDFLAQDAAIEILDELTFGQLVDTLEDVTDALEDSAVPK